MKKNKFIANFLPICGIGMLLSVASFCCVPDVINAGIGKENSDVLSAGIGLLAIIVAILGLLALLRFIKHKGAIKGYVASFFRIVCVMIFFLLISLAMSVLLGFLAVFLYTSLQSALSLDQIKGIIDYASSIFTLLMIPLFVSILWEQIKSEKGFFTAVINGIHIGGRKYLQLVLLLLVSYGIGWLISTCFHYVPDGLGSSVVKIILFGAAGTVILLASEKICKKGVNYK